MNSDDNATNLPADSRPIGDLNVERLLGKAYQPETPDSEFVKRVEALMCSTAREGAEARAHESPRVTIARRPVYQWNMLAWSAVAATILVGVGFVVGRQMGRPDGDGLASGPAGITDLPVSLVDNIDALALPAVEVLAYRPPPSEQAGTAIVGDRGLTPRQRPAAPATEVLEIGNELETDAGHRHRVALADGSVLYLNQNTRVKVEAERQIALRAGEIYVEVAPRLARLESGTEANKGNEGDSGEGPATFIVKTAEREITALGTKFAVRAGSDKANVLVTQGKVQVNDVDQPIAAGQQLAVMKTLDGVGADKSVPAVTPLPRASHVLDWTRDLVAAAESPLVPASEHAGGSIVARDPNGQEARLSLRKYHVDVHIEDGFARTTIDQTYFNHTSWRLEGTFHFPLPPDASLSRLAMYVEGKLMEGGMAERNYAREVFEKIVRTQKDPALLEWVDGSTFKMRVFPLEARQEKRIVLSYTQRLETLYGNSKYRFPAGHSLDTVRDWSFHARVKRGAELTWSCDSHELKDSKDGNDLLLDADAKEVKLDRDVVLRLTDRKQPLTTHHSPLTASLHDGQRYLMLRYRPDLPTKAQRQRRDWVFLFESSGDRDPVLARVQVDVIKTLLQNAEHDDTFAILTAGTQVRAFAKEPMPASPENVKQAIEFLDGVHLVGALDLGQALAAAEPFVNSGKNAYLVHVGSGMPVLGERSEDKLLKRIPAGARYVGVGVGKRWSRQFMKTAASRTGGYFTQINPDEPVAWRAFDLYSTLNTPRLLNAAVVDHAERAAFLVYSDSIAHGEELCAIARLGANDPLPEKLAVSGTLDGEPFRRVIPVENVTPKADYLPRTWAKLRIDQLLADDAAKHKDEIISLSKAMYVMSPFTSLLVLENEQMYVQFNIHRGVKDHWAMYPCPQQIPVVYEPLPVPAIAGTVTAETEWLGEKPSTFQVLSTIVVPLPSRYRVWPNTTSHYSLSQTYLPLFASPDDNRDGSTDYTIEYVAGTGWGGSRVMPFFNFADFGGQLPNSGTWSDESNFRYSVQKPQLARDYAMMNGSIPMLWGLETGYRRVPRKLNLNTIDAPKLGVFMAETSANWYELREARKHRLLLTLIDVDKFHIPFPNEPPIEYPDATWWEEMTRRRRRWTWVDLTAPTQAEQRISQKLREPVTLNFTETPLGDVIDFLRDYTSLNIVLDKVALEEEGLNSDTPVSVHVESVAAKSAFNVLLGQHGLTYQIKDDVLQITSQREAFNEFRSRVYPVMDLVVPITSDLNIQGMDFDQIGRYDALFGRSGLDRTSVLRQSLRSYSDELNKDQQRNYAELQKWYKQARSDALRYSEQAELYGDEAKLKTDEAILLRQQLALRRSEANLRRTQLFLNKFRASDVRDGLSNTVLFDEVAGGESIVGGAWGNPHPLFAAFHMSDDIVDTSTGLTYQRPHFSGDTRVFSDMIAYAPGMSASRADVLAVLESEAEPERTPPNGDIEPLARAIIDKARGAGWQKLSAGEGEKPLTIAFDGSGRYSFERTTAEGLFERVVCDATTLWHLYPELGIGAKRNVSRFHREEFASLVPWLVPTAEDLARGAGLLAINERTVAIVPRGAQLAPPRVASGQDEKAEKPEPRLRKFWSVQLIFAEDGRLAERRLVEMPGGKVLARETYAADGTVKLIDADDKVLAETKFSVEPAAQPDLSPNTNDLVVLPMPTRTVEHVYQTSKQPRDGRFDKWSEEDALKLFAANMIQDPSAAIQIIGQRFFAKGDRRLGFYTLLMASGQTWNPLGDKVMADGSHVRIDPVADHPDSSLARYMFLHQQQMTKSGKIEEMDLATGPAGGFVEQLAAFRDLHVRWTSGKATQGGYSEKEHQRAMEFVRASKSPRFGWSVLTMIQNQSSGVEWNKVLAELHRKFEQTPGLEYAARYERAYCVYQTGEGQPAKELFRDLYAETLKRGVVPPIDQRFRQAFQDGTTGPAMWAALWRDAAERVINYGDRTAALALAWQCHKLGDTAMADELFATAMRGVANEERPAMTLAAVDYLAQTEQHARADALLQPMLEDEKLSQFAWLWRLGAGLAEKHGMTARSVACLDRAIDIEYSRLPDEVELESVRAAFGSLLERYQKLADSIASLQSEPPQHIVRRVIRAADRWRSLDPDDTAACQAAGRVLQRLGVRDAAWEYVTTPLAGQPGEPPQWSSLAETLRGQNDFDLADRAYRSAFDAEPTNAQILWNHAQMLEQRGQADEARQSYRKIAEGSWGPEFQSVQEHARKLVATP